MECQMIQRQPHHPHPAPGHHTRPQIGLGMFRAARPPAPPPPPPEPHSPSAGSLSSEERALFLARTQLLRAQSPFPGPPASPFSPARPLAPALGLQHLWSQWAQLQQLNSALMTPHSAAGQPPAPSPAALFSSLLSQAQRFSPYVISSPSPPPPAENTSPSSSRSHSPVQVET